MGWHSEVHSGKMRDHAILLADWSNRYMGYGDLTVFKMAALRRLAYTVGWVI